MNLADIFAIISKNVKNRVFYVHVFSRPIFREAEDNFPNDKQAIQDLYKGLVKATFKTPDEIRAVYKSLDNFKQCDKWYVIDIGGNNLRLIAKIDFVRQMMFIKYIVTHADYDKISEKYNRMSAHDKQRSGCK